MGFDHETAKAASTRKLQRRQDLLARQRRAVNAAGVAKRSRASRQLGADGRQLLPGLLVKHVELWTGSATRSARSTQRVVRVRSELDAGAAAVVVRLDGDIVAIAFAPQVLKLLRISWPTRRRCQSAARRHRFGCSKHTGAMDADLVNLGLATRSGAPFASGMLQQWSMPLLLRRVPKHTPSATPEANETGLIQGSLWVAGAWASPDRRCCV